MSARQNQSSFKDGPLTKTILVVEDDAGIGQLLFDGLTVGTGYDVLLVPDGFKALEAVKRLKPILFLLDYFLPDMNGLALYDQLHAIKELEDIPAIMVSAALPHSAAKEVQKRHIVFLSKPFKLAELLQLIEKVIA